MRQEKVAQINDHNSKDELSFSRDMTTSDIVYSNREKM